MIGKVTKQTKYRRDEESPGLLYTRSSPFFPRSHLTSHHIRASPAFILEHSRIPCILLSCSTSSTIRDIRYAHSDTDRYMQLSNLIPSLARKGNQSINSSVFSERNPPQHRHTRTTWHMTDIPAKNKDACIPPHAPVKLSPLSERRYLILPYLTYIYRETDGCRQQQSQQGRRGLGPCHGRNIHENNRAGSHHATYHYSWVHLSVKDCFALLCLRLHATYAFLSCKPTIRARGDQSCLES